MQGHFCRTFPLLFLSVGLRLTVKRRDMGISEWCVEVNSLGSLESKWKRGFHAPHTSFFYPLLLGFSLSLFHNVVGQFGAYSFLFCFQVQNSDEDYSFAQIHYWTISCFLLLLRLRLLLRGIMVKYPNGNLQ
jgi:hypothetical protein